MPAGTVYEIFIDDETDTDVLGLVAEQINTIAKDNFEKVTIPEEIEAQITPEQRAEIAEQNAGRGFYIAPGRLTMTEGDWGVHHDIADDAIALSKLHPGKTIKVIHTRALNTVAGIETLGNFWRGDFVDGVMVDTFLPRPIEWKSENERNWYV